MVLKGAIFDLGGTLIHLIRPLEEIREARALAVYDALRQSGAAVDLNDLREKYEALNEEEAECAARTLEEIPVEKSLPRLLDKLMVERKHRPPVFDLVRRFFALEVDSWVLFPRVHEMLADVRASGLRMGVLSNARSDWAIREITTRLDIAKYFDAIVTSAGVGFRKPRPEPFREVLKELGLEPSEVVMIGNSLQADISGARALGLKTVRVIFEDDIDEDEGADPEVTVCRVSGLPLAIKRIAAEA